MISASNVTTRGTDNTMGISIVAGSTDLATRVVHANRAQPDDTGPTGTLTGKFVGKTIDGPIGVIGTWTVQGAGLGNDGTLRGGSARRLPDRRARREAFPDPGSA